MNIIFYIWEIFLFVSMIVGLVLLPGYFVLRLLHVSLTRIEKLTVSLGFGVSAFTLLLYIFGSLNSRFLVYAFLLAISVYALFKKINISFLKTVPNIIRSNFLSSVFITFGTVILGSLLFRSGWMHNDGLSFTEYRDSFWHLGLMEELVRQIPPLHPGFAPLALTNYHYFAHLFGAGFLSLKVFNPLDFYFRLFPFFLTLLYGLALFIVGRKLTKTTLGANLAVIFGYFTGSFAYVLPLFLKYQGFTWHESSFWLSQPFSMVINPSFALSAGLFLIAAFLLIKMTEEHKWKYSVPLIVIAGTLISFKVYAGALILGGLLICGIWDFFKTRHPHLVMSAVLATTLSLFLFIPMNGKDAGSFLVFLPGWFLRSMVESPDRVQIVDWILRENTYAQAGNTFAILRYRVVELLIYMVGNLGIRVLGFVVVIGMLKKLFHMTVIELFLLSTATVGIVVPLLFVQNGSIANTVQFSYYSLIIFSLWLAIFLSEFLKNRTIWFKIILVGIIFILAVPTSFRTEKDYIFTTSTMGVGNLELSAFNYLKENTNRTAIILIPKTPAYINSMMVGTLSDRRLYYSDRLMAENTHKDFMTREENLQNFYHSADTGWNTSLLHDNLVNYVFVDKTVIFGFDPSYYPLKKVFSNKMIDIYKVI